MVTGTKPCVLITALATCEPGGVIVWCDSRVLFEGSLLRRDQLSPTIHCGSHPHPVCSWLLPLRDCTEGLIGGGSRVLVKCDSGVVQDETCSNFLCGVRTPLATMIPGSMSDSSY